MDELEFRPGAKHADVLLALQRAESEISNVRGGAGTSYLGNYLRAVDTNERMLSNVFPIDVVDELVRTQDYWALRSAPEGLATTHQAIGRACDRERQRLHDLWDQLRLEGQRWQHPESRLLVVDTTMFMDADHPFEQIEWGQYVKEKWARIVVPLATIQELDNHKRSGNKTLRPPARTSLKWLRMNLPRDPSVASANLTPAGPLETSVEVHMDGGPRYRSDADGDIVQSARRLAVLSERPTMLVSRDRNMVLRATLAGVEALDLEVLDDT